MNSGLLSRWRASSTIQKDGVVITIWTDTITGVSGSTTSLPFLGSSVFKKELEGIKQIIDRHLNWSEDPVTTHRILALVPRSSRHGKNHAFPRSPLKVPKTPPQYKGR